MNMETKNINAFKNQTDTGISINPYQFGLSVCIVPEQ